MKNLRTNNVAAENSFTIGMGSVLNLTGDYFLYNCYDSPADCDSSSFTTDRKNIESDLIYAFGEFLEKNEPTK